MVPESEIADILQKNPEPADCVRLLINTALMKGGRDNITVLLVHVA